MFTPIPESDVDANESSIDLAPLIDTVFILLVFFLVTATFARTTGIEINSPEATSPTVVPDEALRIVVTPRGRLYLDGAPSSTSAVKQRVQAFAAAQPDQPVVIVADQTTPSGDLVKTLDLAREAGAQNITVAARERTSR